MLCSFRVIQMFSELLMRMVKPAWFISQYSLTSPYGHLYNTDTSLLRTVRLVPEKPKSYIPYFYNTRHLYKADTWFCPFGVRINKVWL